MAPVSDSTLSLCLSKPNSQLMTLKKQLRFYLDQHGMTAAQLARKAKVPKQSLSGWLAGSKPRNIDQVKRVSDSLGVTLDNLMFGVGLDLKDAPAELNMLLGNDWVTGTFEVRFRRVKNNPA